MGRATPMVVALAASSLLIGCGGSGSSSSTTTPSVATATTPALPAGPAQILKSASDPAGKLIFIPSALSARAGKVRIEFRNASPIPHGLTIEDNADRVIATTGVYADATKSLTTVLPAGTYRFYCPVPGHRSAGMAGVLRIS